MRGAASVRKRRRRIGNIKNQFTHKKKLAKEKERLLGKNGKIENQIVSEFWDKSKGVRKNLADMGLVADANKTFGVPTSAEALGIVANPGSSKKKSRRKKKSEVMQLDARPEAIRKMEEEANKPPPKLFKFGAELSKFIVYCMEKYGDDYEAMARDKRNYYQESAGQIREKIKKFKKIPANWNAYQLAKEQATDTIDESMLSD